MSVTIHRVDSETGPKSGGNDLGILWRFLGHVNGGSRRFPPGQPKWGYQPFGAIAWLRWMNGSKNPPLKQFYLGDSDGVSDHGTYRMEVGRRYRMKARCETLPDVGSKSLTRYSSKVWEDSVARRLGLARGATEATALRTGVVALLAHHVDATIGDVTICPFDPQVSRLSSYLRLS